MMQGGDIQRAKFGFSLQKGRRAFFMQKTTENTENT